MLTELLGVAGLTVLIMISPGPDLALVARNTLVGGKGAGWRGGRHLRYPKDTPMTNLLISMLGKAGVPMEQLGDSTGRLTALTDV